MKTALKKDKIAWIEKQLFLRSVFCPGYQHMPMYRMGRWDSKQYFIVFKEKSDYMHFKLVWGE